MPTYLIYADKEHLRRADGANSFIATAADVNAARALVHTLLGEPNAVASWLAVDLATVSTVAIDGLPTGGASQSVLPKINRGGNLRRSG
jgi:hypothetical protein